MANNVLRKRQLFRSTIRRGRQSDRGWCFTYWNALGSETTDRLQEVLSPEMSLNRRMRLRKVRPLASNVEWRRGSRSKHNLENE
jgi:hypothetical protein